MSSPENSLSDDGKDDDISTAQHSSDALGGDSIGAIFKDAVLTEFEEVGRQVGAGVYWMKRVSRVMKKFAALEAQFSKDVLKLIDHEVEKAVSTINVPARGIYKDQMPRTWNAIQQFHGALRDVAQSHADHANAVLSCAKPIKHFFKNTHPKLLKQVSKLDASNKAIALAKDKAFKQKAKVMASYETGGQSTGGMLARGVKGLRASMSGTFGDVENSAKGQLTSPGPAPQPQSGLKIGKILSSVIGASSSNLLAPDRTSSSGFTSPNSPSTVSSAFAEKKIDETPQRRSSETPPDDKTMALAKEYMKMVDQINQMQEKFLSEELVEAHNFFESTERARIEILQSQLILLVSSYGGLKGKFDDTMERLTRQLSMVSTQADLYNFVNLVERLKGQGAAGKAKNYVGVDYDLPFVKEKDVKKGSRKESGVEQTGIFALTLYELLKVERETDPHLKVPQIFTILVNALKDKGGMKTEGIFRISAAKQAIDNLRQQFLDGNYVVNVEDPHVPAGLLKDWMRGMPEPLFTHNVYDECIKIAKEECQDPQVYMDVMSKLHEVNRHVIYQLIELIMELTKPENLEFTKMNLKNLAIVFAPSFLRYKGNDPMMMLKNNVLELQFVMNLVTLYNPETFKAVKTKGKKNKHERTKSQDMLAKFDAMVADQPSNDLDTLDSKDHGDEISIKSVPRTSDLPRRTSDDNASMMTNNTKSPLLSGEDLVSLGGETPSNAPVLELHLSSELTLATGYSEPGSPSADAPPNMSAFSPIPESPAAATPAPAKPPASPEAKEPDTDEEFQATELSSSPPREQ